MEKIHHLRLKSKLLQKNPLGDPYERDVFVFAPDAAESPPVIYMLPGFTGSGRSFLNDSFGTEAMPTRILRLQQSGAMPKAIVVFVDAITRYGGSQFINSAGTGAYADYIVKELVPFVDAHFATNGRRGLAGKSSGGFGALRLAMAYPKIFHAAACHSGDMHFEVCYPRSFGPACRRLGKHASTKKFFAAWEAMPKKAGDSFEALELIAMSSCYSPTAGTIGENFELPVDIGTCTRNERVWKRWLKHDPLVLLEQQGTQRAISGLRHLHIDCGTRDEFFLDFGARKFSARCKALGIAHDFETFDDTHRDISYRYDVSLPKLARALSDR